MSLSDALEQPAPPRGIFDSVHRLFHGRSLAAAVKYVGVIGGAGLLAASYQIAYEEGRSFIQSFRTGVMARRDRNNAVMCALLSTELPLPVLNYLRQKRDCFSAAIDMSVNPEVDEGVRKTIGSALRSLIEAPSA